jgi:hypothetical protein
LWRPTKRISATLLSFLQPSERSPALTHKIPKKYGGAY